MKTLIFSMSLNGEHSITLASLRFISKTHTDDTFDELIMPKTGVLTDDMLAKFKDADLVILASGMYHFNLSSQSMDAMKTIGEYMQKNGLHTPVTLFTTSGFMMDVIPHEYTRKWAERYGLKYIKGESIYSSDILDEKYRADVYAWYHNVRVLATEGTVKLGADFKEKIRVVYTDDSPETEALGKQYLDAFASATGGNTSCVEPVRLSDYEVKHCLGCQYCYTDRQCCIKDDFEKLCRDIEAGSAVQMFIGTMENGFFSSMFKKFMDRHVAMGRCPDDDEAIMLFAWHEGPGYKPGDEELFRTWANSYASFGGAVFMDVHKGFNQDVVDATVVAINENVGTYRNFYGTSLRRKFADLAYEIQNVEPLDYKYFAQHGDLKPVQRNMQCRPVHSTQDAKMAVQMKSMPVCQAVEHAAEMQTTIPKRRAHMGGLSMLDYAKKPPYADYEVQDSDLSPSAQKEAKFEPGELPPQAIAGRKIGKRMGLLMNTFNTIIFSTIGTLASGHFTWKSWFIGACIGWITGHMITSFVPVNEVQNKVLKKKKINPESVKGRIIASLVTSCIIFPIMTLVMGTAMPRLAMSGIEKNIASMESQVVEQYEKQAELKSQQADLIAQRDELKGKQTELKAEQTALKAQQSALQTSMEKTIENATSGAIAERLAAVDELNASIEELKARETELNEKIAAAQSPAEQGPLKGQLAGVQGELEGKNAAVAELEASIAATKSEIEESVKTGTPEEPGMQKGIDEMQKGIDEMQSGIDEMQSGIDNMQSGIDGMQEGIDGMQNGIDGPKQGIKAQREAIEGMKASLKKSLPISIVFQTLIGIILGFFTQPFFLKLVKRSVLGKEEEN